MTRRVRAFLSVSCAGLTLAGCASSSAPTPGPRSAAAPRIEARPAQEPSPTDDRVRSTILRGAETYPGSSAVRPPWRPRPGPVALNLPGVGVGEFAKAVFGDILRTPYAVAPSASGVVTLVTPRPVARADVLPLAEDALRGAGLALVVRDGVQTIVSLAEARAQSGPVTGGQPGFGTETIQLKFASPAALKSLLEPIAPGVITAADPVSNTIVLSGASGQRRGVRDLVEQFDVDWLKGMSFGLYVPKNTDARLIAPELDRLINAPDSPMAGRVKLIAMEKLNGVMAVSSQAQHLDDIRRWVEILDREGQSDERRLFVYRVQNGRASDLSRVLSAAFGRGMTASAPATGADGRSESRSGLRPSSSPLLASPPAGTTLPGQSPTPVSPGGGGLADGLVLTGDDSNNAVIAFATPREYALIEDALRKLDVAPMQVVVEAVITEIALNNALRYGSQWFIQSGNDQAILSQGKTQAAAPNFPGFAYLLNSGSVAATLTALSTVTDIEVLSAPNLMVLNNHTASLEVGDQVPISTGSALNNDSVISSIDYRDTGVLLKVTPRVNSGGLVLLDIVQEVSDVSQTSSSTIDSPTISVRKIATSIAVQDGQTVALGGLIRDRNSKTRDGVPLISAVPVLGALAGSRDNRRERTELLVMLTPRVLRNSVEIQAVTDELREKIRSIAPAPPKFLP
ncbi:type II secretion system secretin GspD [Caulobacter endophyticus]|uniref:type II secretion system secretin GspD n=1 Tax=Caulobacter endophyticus TaxID=2172652 RepID=UPI00240FA679|nr:type II secretion system secretin GspD [Caulobacter endophyticus]MDG2527268.1 type II secretion system secretin GspD [Caulobacter endophyticus]